MAAKKTTTKRTARKAASKKRRSTKAPSKAQLAARAKFAAAAKARSKKAQAKKKTVGSRQKSVANSRPKRRKNKTVIVKPKRVLVVNGKKKAAKNSKSRAPVQGFSVGDLVRVTDKYSDYYGMTGYAFEKDRSFYVVDLKIGRDMYFKPSQLEKASTPRARNSAKASPKAKQIRKDFTGMESKKTAVLLAPKGTPTNLAKLGKLILIKTEHGTIKPPKKGTTWLCADTKGKLHIATSVPYDGPTGSFGEVTQVEYETAKPHLGHKSPTIFFHKLGEEGGRKPTLSADKEGLRFRGGSYKITRQGIVD